jgi:ribosomal subunit interface protein
MPLRRTNYLFVDESRGLYFVIHRRDTPLRAAGRKATGMQLDIRGRGFPLTEALRAHCERRLSFALARFGPRLGRVGVRLSDVNGPRGGVDKRCQVKLPLAKGRTLTVQSSDADLYAAIDRAADRAAQAVSRELERERTGAWPSIRSY